MPFSRNQKVEMKTINHPPKDINDYIDQQTPDVQATLQSIRAAIKNSAPETEELIRDELPAFRLAEKLLIVYIEKEEVSVLTTPIIRDLQGLTTEEDLNPNMYLKVAAEFPYDQPITFDFIRRIN
jgi:uncharacterized protein YdhG (YjbR/CyaY superfamily)